jgi:hypothetical protein
LNFLILPRFAFILGRIALIFQNPLSFTSFFRIFATEDDERTASCQKETVDYDSIYTQSVRGCFGVVAPNHVAFLRRSQVYGACM